MAALFQVSAPKKIRTRRRLPFATLIFHLILASTLAPPNAFAAEVKETNPARLKISGFGFFGNRELKQALKLIQEKNGRPEYYDANTIEDAAFIVLSRVRQEGFLQPALVVELDLEDGSSLNYTWGDTVEPPLPRPTKAKTVSFRIEKGRLYRYGELKIDGIHAISRKAAGNYFVEKGVLVPMKRTRIYTPQRLERGVLSLTEILMRQGFETAEVSVVRTNQNDLTGKVDVSLAVREGPQSIVRSIRVETRGGDDGAAPEVSQIETNQPFSRLWEQDFAQSLRTIHYHQGYPDTRVDVSVQRREAAGETNFLEVLASVRTGQPVLLRDVRFEGQRKTRGSVLDRRVRLKHGGTNLLDRVAVEQGRTRLARLGVFDNVDLRYEPAGDEARDVIYELREGKRIDVSLLLGYGSYELFRGGVEMERHNIFGRAHRDRLRLVQSFKASSADYIYTMPEFVGEDMDLFFNSSWLRREEISFERREFGGGAGLRKYFKPIESELGVRYNYEVLDASGIDVAVGPRTANVGAFIFELKHDERDHPLYPQNGYKVYSSFEIASPFLAGDVSYERGEIAISWHQPLDEGRWFHFGLSHGFVYTLDSPAVDLPFNKRFFPGGENSVRGYQYGEAAPRDKAGNLIGAEVYTTANLEFEQAITESFSFVSFADGVLFSRDIGHYPGDEHLVSVGGGFRWRTVIGPIRLEYGYNLNPRPRDPIGTLHVTVGFPF